jgi:L-ribulose-5-phosphate 3-epimerase
MHFLKGECMLSINTWAFDPTLTFAQRVSAASIAGFKAVEINFEEGHEAIPLLTWDTPSSTLREMQKTLHDHGCVASGVCTELFWHYSLASSESVERQKSRDLALKMMEYAAALRAPSIVIIPGILCTPRELGTAIRQQSSMDVWARAVDEVQCLAEQGKEMGVVLGIENVHFNSFLTSPLELRSFIATINHPFVKAHLDVGNANIAGAAHDWIEVMGDNICAIHVKDTIQWQSNLDTFRALGCGNVDWNAVKASLMKIRYEGFLTVEQSFNKKLPQSVFLQSLFKTASKLVIGG